MGPQSDQEMIELDDDSDTIDIEAIEQALNYKDNSPERKTDSATRGSFQ